MSQDVLASAQRLFSQKQLHSCSWLSFFYTLAFFTTNYSTMDKPVNQENLLLRTLAMPADTNPNGDIFGGWIMSQMDIAGGIMAKSVTHGRIVTVAVESMKFIEPVSVGDTVCVYGRVVKVGTTSITIELEVWVSKSWAENPDESARRMVTEANFIYVAIDGEGNKRKVDKSLIPELV